MLNFLLCVLTDMAESLKISDAISAVLPDLPDEVVMSVEDTLKTLGAVTTDDLQYITEGDLLPILKPIQARRMVAAWVSVKHCHHNTAHFSYRAAQVITFILFYVFIKSYRNQSVKINAIIFDNILQPYYLEMYQSFCLIISNLILLQTHPPQLQPRHVPLQCLSFPLPPRPLPHQHLHHPDLHPHSQEAVINLHQTG